jgi:hypothetical protein
MKISSTLLLPGFKVPILFRNKMKPEPISIRAERANKPIYNKFEGKDTKRNLYEVKAGVTTGMEP